MAHARAVDRELASLVGNEVDGAAMRHLLGCHFGWIDDDFEPLPVAPVDRLTGAVALLCYQAAAFERTTGEVSELLPFAAAVELLHSWTVVHEEVLEGVLLRQGRPALWTRAGRPRALEAAACLHALAFRCLARPADPGVRPHRVVELMSTLAHASVTLAVGHGLGLPPTEAQAQSERYLGVLGARSAALLGCAAAGGALLAKSDDPKAGDVVAGYRRFGLHLGLALRAADDVAGTWGVEGGTARHPGGDIRRRKWTLPVVFALHHAPEHDRQVLRNLYSLTTCLSAEQAALVRQVLDGCGADVFARAQVEAHCSRALSALRLATVASEMPEANPFLAALVELSAAATARLRISTTPDRADRGPCRRPCQNTVDER